jgi:hypothetical protein
MHRKTKTFPIGAVLSVVTGRLVSENHMTGIYDVLSWMTGENVYTHQIPRISREATPVILAMHPHLKATIDEAEQITPENVWNWLATWKDRYGDEIAVPLMSIAEHERIDPQSELAEMVHPDRIVTIDLKGGAA